MPRAGSEEFDAVVVGSGPNGLAAAVELAREGFSVLVLEAAGEIGGGTRTAELTLPGFLHDVCSGVHPLGALSPFFRELELDRHGLTWIGAPVSLAHPLDDGSAALLVLGTKATGETLGADGEAWRAWIEPFLRRPDDLFRDLLGPLRFPRWPLGMARFGLYGLRSAQGVARSLFAGERARALFAGCAAHSVLPLTHPVSAAVGLVFAISGHVVDWPVARGGSRAIAHALASCLLGLGGEIRVATKITSMAELPRARAVLFDLAPAQMASIAKNDLPASYLRRLSRYRYGPAVFKLDWALSGPIPWKAKECAGASTVHVGGTLEEIAASEEAMWRGEHAERPFVLVAQQSHFDTSRAPEGMHTGYAYCHVPARSDFDMTERIEAQIERFAPGFRDLIRARHARGPLAFEAYNPAYIGGSITGGVSDLRQLFTRPVARCNPYTTPNPSIFLCSQATPPGGGVHGMCGYFAARAACKRLKR